MIGRGTAQPRASPGRVDTGYTPVIEPLSLDEAYLAVTENLKGTPSVTKIAVEIRERIRAETGLTASAGVSYDEFLAKLASDHRKPGGLLVIDRARETSAHAAELRSLWR